MSQCLPGCSSRNGVSGEKIWGSTTGLLPPIPVLEACGAASHDSIMGKVTLVAPGRGSQKAAFGNWVLAFQAQRTNSGLVHKSPFRDVTLPFKLGTVFQCVCLLRVSGGVNGAKGVVR